MSYILDALRRADSERERGSIPTLHANARARALGDDDEDVSRRGHSSPLLWAVVGLSVALAGVLGWLFIGGSEPQTSPVVASPAPAPAPMAPATLQAPAPALVSPAPVAQEAQQVPRAAAPSPSKEADATTRTLPERAESTKREALSSTERASKDQAPSSKVVKPPVRTAVEEKPAPKVADLPEDIRRQLPQLSVSGASYSENPSRRMLILNGQVFREGDKVAEGLQLVQIQLKSAVLDFRGQRYSISY